MKTKSKITSIILVAFLLVGSTTAFSQIEQGQQRPMKGQRQMKAQVMKKRAVDVLDLTEEQQSQLTELRTKHQKGATYKRNQIREKEAHLKTLLSAPEFDKKAVNKTIDAIAEAKGEIMKEQIAHRQEMKSFLSEEQIQKMGMMSGRRGAKGHRGGQQFGEKGSRGYHGQGMQAMQPRGRFQRNSK